jgi:phospholipase C
MKHSAILFLCVILLPLSLQAAPATDKRKLDPVKHIIVFYLENHSFDNLFGTFPGADGIANAKNKTIQTDADDKPYDFLPQVEHNKQPDTRFPDKLPNKPFLITRYVPANALIGDPIHRFYQTQEQMNGGKMDKFALVSDAGALVMGYYHEKDSPLWQYAKRYTLADHFFVGAFGGSTLNHFWLICACTPRYEDAPDKLFSTLDDDGNLVHDGALTPDGFAVNTIQPMTPPFDPAVANPEMRLPLQTMPTIGDRLSAKHISWAWYGGGWKKAVAGKAADNFPYHHHPFAYFARYAEGTEERREHLKDETDFVAAITAGKLPPVSFFKPLAKDDMHPGYSKLHSAEEHVFGLIQKIEQSPLWNDSVIIVTFDDAGGFWDHVPPPKGDRFGPGERIPTLIISPFSRKGFVDHTVYDTTSILKLIETKFGLKPLGTRDAKAHDLTNALE